MAPGILDMDGRGKDEPYADHAADRRRAATTERAYAVRGIRRHAGNSVKLR